MVAHVNVERPRTPADHLARDHLLRGLMGFCMFHGCTEVALLSETDLASHGVAVRAVGGVNATIFV